MGKIIGFFTGKLWWLKALGSLIVLFLVFKLLMFLWNVVAFANPDVKDLGIALRQAQGTVREYAVSDSISRAERDSCEALRFTMEGNYQLQIIKLTQASKKYEARAVYAEAVVEEYRNGGCSQMIIIDKFLKKPDTTYRWVDQCPH